MHRSSSSWVLGFMFVVALASSTVATATAASNKDDKNGCACQILDRPDLWQKEMVARWMVHTMDWGVLSTINTRLDDDKKSPIPFGNVYSFVDGPCDKSTGIPYFYGTYMDASFHDMKSNPSASFTLSEASLASVCGAEATLACQISKHHMVKRNDVGDPESPICARLTLTGRLVELDPSSDEYAMSQEALYQRHEQMSNWPIDHNWVIAKLEIEQVWFIDYFGGPSILDVDDYFNAELIPKEIEDSN